jgi:translocation and assembly module TamB
MLLRTGAALAASLFLAVWLLFFSEAGLHLLRQIVDGRGGIAISTVSGSLGGRFTLEKIAVVFPGLRLGVDSLLCEWQPLALLRGELHLADIQVRGVVLRFVDDEGEAAAAKAVTPSTSQPAALPGTLLPLPLLLDRLAIAGLRLEDEAGEELLVIDTFLLQLRGGVDQLALHTLALQGPEIGVSLHGTIDFSRQWQVDLLGEWNLVEYGFHPLQGTLSASGPLAAPQGAVAIHSPVDIRVEGQVANLFNSPSWTATLRGNNVDLEKFIEYCPRIMVKTIHGQLSGSVEGYGGLVKADVDWGVADNLHLETNISASLLGIDFDTLSLTRGKAKLRADGASIDWKRLFDWRGRFLVEGFDPTMFFPWLPGSIDGEIENIGTVRDDLGVDASFTVRHLRGTLHDVPVAADGDLMLTENDISTRGINLRSGEVEGNVEVLAGKLSWADTLDWDLSLRLTEFDPASIASAFPGRISGVFEGRGVLGEAGGEGYLRISDVSGNLRGNDLSGSGEITLAGESLTTSGLFLQSGASKLVVEGRAGESFALDMRFDSPDIGSLVPDSAGELHLRGSLRGTMEAPQFDLDMRGVGVVVGDHRFGTVEAALSSRFGEEKLLGGFIALQSINTAGIALDRARLDAAGTFDEQRMTVRAEGTFGAVEGQAEVMRRSGWQGRVLDLQLNSDRYGRWRQQRPSGFFIGDGEGSLDELCLGEVQALLCLEGALRWHDPLAWQLRGRTSGFDLDQLNRWQLLQEAISGTISGEIQTAGVGNRLTELDGGFRVPKLRLDLGVEDEELAAGDFEDAALTLKVIAGELHGQFITRMKNGGLVNLTAALDGTEISPTSLRSLPLSGKVRVSAFNLAVLSALTGYGIDPMGTASGEFLLDGTLARPQLIGEARLDQGGVNLPYQGISLEGISLRIEAAEDGARLSGRMVSGPGTVMADGTLRYGEQGIEGALRLSGKNFLLVNLPEWAITVDPTIDLTFSQKNAHIKGLVTIPNALLTPEEMKDSVSESPDVVLIDNREQRNGGGLPFSLDLDILLGDGVRIDGYGLSGRLGGSLRVKTAAGDPPTALGELNLIGGTYTIYGRTLDIARGRILFTGGPIDNPGVDVRAQRTFSDEVAKTRGYTVGVDISGLAQDLQFQLFSDPYMDKTEILSQLVVGRSLAFSTAKESGLLVEAAATLGLTGGNELFQGIGSIFQLDSMHLEGSSNKEDVSLVVGKRLTKDLYVGYDVNMFSQLGRFRVRYDLTNGFAVETSSSSQSTGADLLYSFEK